MGARRLLSCAPVRPAPQKSAIDVKLFFCAPFSRKHAYLLTQEHTVQLLHTHQTPRSHLRRNVRAHL